MGSASDGFLPTVASSQACDPIHKLFSSLGFKYGPVTLLFYWPFFLLLGPAGFIFSHVLLIIAAAALLWRWAFDKRSSIFWCATALVLFLWPTHLAWNALVNEHLDLPPVFLTLLGWRLADSRNYNGAAVCLGLSFAAKFLPAALFLPLLLPAPRRTWIYIAGVTLACFAPFAGWDFRGLSYNLGYPFTRLPDSTAAAFFLTQKAAAALRIAAILMMALLARRAHQAHWDGRETVEYLAGSILLVLATGATFHNNYLLWLLPVLSMFSVMTAPSANPTVGFESADTNNLI
jgi:hypothetical protein